MKRNKALLFTIIFNFLILSFNGCLSSVSTNDAPVKNTSYIDNVEVEVETETESDYEENVKAYIDSFERDHPDYLIADYIINSDSDSVIKSAIMTEDKETGYKSTVFIQTEAGIAVVTVNSGFPAYYIAADKLVIQDAQVIFAADCPSTDGKSEIHDYVLTVEIVENPEGIKGIVVKNKETIRQN